MSSFKAQKKKSSGKLRPAIKTMPEHPDMLGHLDFRFEDFQELSYYLKKPGDEVSCKLAAWVNSDNRGTKYLSVVFQPPYRHQRPQPEPERNTMLEQLLLGVPNDDEYEPQ